ncbi:Golgi to ER traffic protein 2 [Scheffersomyces xylosifermentans]|uniref:Golgi to ER traffic protein 2 n=1 Tax=Scheffersomyces xylosifermentans TaxID=1304137 RepID=UPI00315D0CA6
MSDSPSVSAEERKRILRERRAAKMKQGNATNRLNTILTQGSSVKDVTPVKSVLDDENISLSRPHTPVATTTSVESPIAKSSSKPKENTIHTIHHDSDPDHQDISSILGANSHINDSKDSVANSNEDIDEMFKKIFGGQAPGGAFPNLGGAGASGAEGEDPFAQMMKMLGQQGGAGGNGGDQPNPFGANPEEIQYQQQLTAYRTYQHKLWKCHFLVVRYLSILANFFYHFIYVEDSSFQSSSHSYIRGLAHHTPAQSFFVYFSTIEVVILATYYFLGTKEGFFTTTTSNNFIIKILDMGAMVLPQLAQIRLIAVRVLGYYELLAVVLGDLSLVVVLFGLLSTLGN